MGAMLNAGSICFGLLAGGQSSRMGMDKASLGWRGQPLWKHQLRLAVEIGATEILISGKAEGPYGIAAPVVLDAVQGAGPLAGLAALLNAMKSDWLLAVAVDMPLLDGGILRKLLAARAGDKGAVPCLGGQVEPLAAVYPRAARTLVSGRLQLANRSLQAFVGEAVDVGLVKLQAWPAESAKNFRSINTAAEYAAARATRVD